MKTPLWALALVAASAAAAGVSAQQAGLDRQPPTVLDVLPPSARVAGSPGHMTIARRGCQARPAADVRRRIIELAAQEWGFFGFSVVDRTDDEGQGPPRRGWRGWRRRPGDAQSARVASSIAGYWAVTPGGAWILESQNAIWRRPGGSSDRWRYWWSAAFTSWVMCESGLADAAQFQTAIAHHTYIDQAIRARDGRAPRSAFVAYDSGEANVATGDLLCTARRPVYHTLAERRRQMGEGASTHCDIVVKVDADAGRLFAIGGNVRGTVGLKALPLTRSRGILRVAAAPAGSRMPVIFAHLKLRQAYRAANVFDADPTVQALGCRGQSVPAWRAAVDLVAPAVTDCAGR